MASFTIKTSTGRNNVLSYVVGYESLRYRWQYFDFVVPKTVPGTSIPVTSAKIVGGTLSGTVFNYTIGSGDSSEYFWDSIPFYFTVRSSNQLFDSVPPTADEAIGTVNFYKLADSYNPNIDFWNRSPILVKTKDRSLIPGQTYTIGFYTLYEALFWRWWTDTPFDLQIEYESYTKCSPPTSISLTPTIQKRDGNVTIKWSGAKGGSSNAITKYGIQYKIGSGSWTETKYVTSSATSGSYSFTIPATAAQGANIRAAVKTIGTASGYDSDWGYSSTTAGKVNTIPGTPTINFSSQILPSSGGQITLSIVDEGVDPDGQSVTLEYKLGENGQLKSFSNATVLTESGTYYFYSKDSLGEQSYPLMWAITRNSKPSVSISRTAGAEAVSYRPSSDPISYVYNPTFTFTTSGGQDNNNKYTCKLYAGDSSDSLNLKETLLQNSSDARIAITDIRSKIGTGVYYKIEVMRNDGVENCSDETDVYFIPSPSGIESISNKIGSKSGVSDFEEYFSSGIQPYLYKDTGYNQLEVSIDGTYYSRFSLTNEGDNLFFSQISNISENSFLRGTEKTFQFSLYNSTTGYKKSIATDKGTFTRINHIANFREVANLTWDGPTNPFDSPGDEISFLNIFNTTSITEELFNAYGFSEAPQYTIKTAYSSKNSSITLPANHIGNDTVNIRLIGEQIFNLYKDLGMNKNTDTVYSTTFSVSFENVFGDVYEASIVKQIEWGTSPVLILDNLKIGGLSDPPFVKEGMLIEGTLTIRSYHGDLKDIKIEGIKNKTVFYSTIITPDTKLSEPTSQTIVSGNYLLANSSLKIGEQLTDLTGGNIDFVITGTNILGKSVTITKTLSNCNVYRHVPGQVNISSASYDNNNNITYTFNFSNLGMNNILKEQSEITEIKIITKDSTNDISNVSFEADSYTKTLNDPPNGQFLEFWIQGTITSYRDKNNDKNEKINVSSKTFFSNKYTVYNSSPTVSYRKNQVGINVNLSNIDSEESQGAAVVISGHSGKNKILFKGTNFTGTININDGKISGFIIDGGSWD